MRWNIFDDSRLAFNGSNGAISTFGRVGLVGTKVIIEKSRGEVSLMEKTQLKIFLSL